MKTTGIIVRLIILALLIFGIGKCIHYFNNNKYYSNYDENKKQSVDIYSLETQTMQSGSFILFVGSFDSEDYYVFYKKTASGGFIRDKVRAERCVIYEGYEKPRLVENGYFLYCVEHGDTINKTFNRKDWGNSYHSLYLPSNTITKRINDIKL